MISWVALSYGALDMREWKAEENTLELVLLPVYPIEEPIGLAGPPAELWRRLVEGPVDDAELTPEERSVVREFEVVGLASSDASHPARTVNISKPWFVSPLHELVCSLMGSIARELGAEMMIVKGPMLKQQGLRQQEHSGDVDLWMRAADIERMNAPLEAWGWAQGGDLWERYGLGHSVTFRPNVWGCEVDVHRRMTGIGADDASAFELLLQQSTDACFAGVNIRVPRPEAHAVIAGLHMMRPEPGRARPGGVASATAKCLAAAGVESLTFAERVGSYDALYEAAVIAFPDEQLRTPTKTFVEQWGLHAARDRVQMYFWASKSLPLRRRISFLWWACWPSNEFVNGSERFSGENSRSTIQARLKRIGRGVRTFVKNG